MAGNGEREMLHYGSRSKNSGAANRARLRWRNVALETRCDLRSIGVTGSMPELDRRVVGTRGVSGPDENHFMAATLCNGGVQRDKAKRSLAAYAESIVDDVYDEAESQRTADGPGAA